MGIEQKDGKPTPPPRWRYGFFALTMLLVLAGGNVLNIPREVQIPVLIGCIIAIANGELPRWFGKGRE